MRNHGEEAYPRPSSIDGHENVVFDQRGMSYRDWLVGGMMREYFALAYSGPVEEFHSALLGDEAIQRAVLRAHAITDVILRERYK